MNNDSLKSIVTDLYDIVSQENLLLKTLDEKYEIGKFINNKTNLNNLFELGNYYCANATNNLNNIILESLPEQIRGNCGFKLIINELPNNSISQLIITEATIDNDSLIFYRSKVNNYYWKEWRSLFNNKDNKLNTTIENLNKNIVHTNPFFDSDTLSLIIKIGSDSSNPFDLNTLTPDKAVNYGEYIINGLYLLNAPPLTKFGRLIIMSGSIQVSSSSTNPKCGTQIIIENSSNNIYIRYYSTNDIWGNWIRVAFANEVETVQANITAIEERLKKHFNIDASDPSMVDIVKTDSELVSLNSLLTGNYQAATASKALTNVDPTSVPSEIVNDSGVILRGFRLIAIRTTYINGSWRAFTQIMIANSTTNKSYDAKIFVRSMAGGSETTGVWGDWTRLAYKEDITNLEESIRSTVPTLKHNYCTNIVSNHTLYDDCCGRIYDPWNGLVNLDDLKTPGNYKCESVTAAINNVLPSSAPSDIIDPLTNKFLYGFKLIIETNNSNTHIHQTLIADRGAYGSKSYQILIFHRHLYTYNSSNTWSNWERVIYNEEFDYLDNNVFHAKRSSASKGFKLIGNPDNPLNDLNNICYNNTTGVNNCGDYYCIGNNVGNITHKPEEVNSAFRLYAFLNSVYAAGHLLLIEVGKNTHIYMRYYEYINNQTVWYDWHKMATEDVVQAEESARIAAIEAEAEIRQTTDNDIKQKAYTLNPQSWGGIELIKNAKENNNCACWGVNPEEDRIDLATIITPGTYYTPSKAKAQINILPTSLPEELYNQTTLAITNAFKLIVESVGSNQMIYQTLIVNPTSSTSASKVNPRIFYRARYTYSESYSWSPWTKVATMDYVLDSANLGINANTISILDKNDTDLPKYEQTGLIDINKLPVGNYFSTKGSGSSEIKVSENVYGPRLPEDMYDSTSLLATLGFKLWVMRNSTYGWQQILFSLGNATNKKTGIYFRHGYGSTLPSDITWSAWKKLAVGKNLESAFLLNGTSATAIPNGSDLNTYTTPGNYTVTTMEISATILHKPHTNNDPFRLTVMQNTAATSPRIYLFVTTSTAGTVPTTTSDRIYFRCSFDNNITWTAWDTIASGTALANLKSTIDTDIKPKLANKFDNVAYNSSDHEITLSSNDTNGKSVTVQLTDIGDMDDRKIGYATYSDEEGEDQYYLKLYNKNPGEGGLELQRIKIVGGGGGGGGKTSVVTMTNDSGWVTKAFSADVETIPFKFSWTSYIGTVPTGPGTLQIIVKSNTEIKTYNLSLASQEQVTIDLKNYVTKDSKITLKVIDSLDNYSMMYLTVKLVSASISSTYNQTIVNTTQISVPYTPYGTTTDGVKTVYFKINGSTFTETISGQEEKVPRTKVIDIPSTWLNGVYTMQVYFTMPLAGEAEPIMSNIIYLNCFIDNNTGVITPYIGSTYTPDSTTNQYDTVTIPYFVYKRGASETNVLLRYKKGTESSWTTFGTVSAPFSELKWNFTFMTLENDTTTPYTLSICAMEGTTVKAEKQFVFSVKKSTVTIKVHDADRPVYLSAAGRSNNEAAEVRNTWVDEKTGVTSTITNVQWGSYDGWLTSSYDSTIPAKETVLRLMNGGSCVVNYAPFLADNFDLDKGICFEIKLRAKDIKELSTPFLTVWSSDTQRDYGIKIKPEDIIHTGSDKIKASAKYKENEFTTITILIHRWSTEQPDAEHMVYIYLNGILSFVREYSTNEKFFHQVGGLLEIGGTDDCTVDISRIRIYNTTLTDDLILNNYLCDISDSSLIVDNASRNNIMNNGEPDLDSIKLRMPCMILYTSQEFDKDKTKMNYKMEYYDPDNTQKNFFIDYDEEGYSNKKHNVATQGTSSAEYPLRNFKFLFRKILVGPEAAEGKGTQQTSYKLFDDVPTSNIFTVKVNFASSEQCNNTVISQLFNDACAWKFPKQDYRSDLRFGIKGKPIAIFRLLAGESKPTFYSLGLFNLDKGSYKDIGADVFGFSKIYGTKGSSTPYSDTIWYDEGGWCIEISNNADAALFKKTYDELYEGYDELGKWQCEAGDAFEYRYRYDGLEAITKKELLPEIFKNALTAIANAGKMAEGTALKNAIINAVHTYFERDSLLYYFNFNNFTMGTDLLAKNAMMAYHGGFKRKKNDDPTAEGWIERDPTKIFMMIYDSDTCLGINNQGQYYEGPSYSYELGDSEIVEQGTGKAVWSATNSVLFKLIKKYMEDDYVYNNVEYKGYGSMYADMRKYNPKSLPNPYMSYEYLDTQFSSMQNKWPERLWNYQMRKAYINTYLALGTEALQLLMGTKELQRRFFLNRRIIYLDSRYHTGESSQATIYFRANAKESSTNDISADARIKLKYNQYLTGSVKWLDTAASGSYTNKKVTDTTQVYEFACPVNVPENANIYVQSANKLTYAAGFGDYCPDSVSLSLCENLRYFSIRPLLEDSDGTPHVNPTAWKSISMGSDIHPLTQLEEVDLSNNTGLALNINLSYAPNIRKVNCENTKVPNVLLIAGAPITHLHLSPETTTIVLEKLNKLTNLTIDVAENSKKVTTIKLDEIPTTLFDIDTFYSLGKCAQNRTCTLVYKLATYGSSSTSVSAVKTYFTNLATKFCGPSGTGNPEVHIKDLYVSLYTDADKLALKDLGVSVTNWHGTYSFTVHFVSEDGTTEYAHYDCTGPTTVTYNKATPTKEPTATQLFTFKSWLREDGSEVTAVTFKRRCTETEYIKAQFTGTDRLYTVYLNNITV